MCLVKGEWPRTGWKLKLKQFAENYESEWTWRSLWSCFLFLGRDDTPTCSTTDQTFQNKGMEREMQCYFQSVQYWLDPTSQSGHRE